MNVEPALLTACSGFLLSTLWMDLIFDIQVRGRRGELPEPVLASIADYYRRATTTSKPMSLLIAVVMLILLCALGIQAFRGDDPGWLLIVSAPLAGGPILLAITRVVPNAMRLGGRSDTSSEQTRLSRSIFQDHVLCFASMLTFLVLWVIRSTGVFG
ncbi:hypothetical protein [Nocardia sp. NBC_00403]|uniref:hypothetical protein n=1 Tax=Nocardia sp. NBC_00403 TaxID=2975990 RepID=UPI002E1DFB08